MILDMPDVTEAGDDMPTFALEGLIHSAATVVYGKPFAGKSYLTLSLARSLASGEPWLGRKVLTPGKVAIWALDPGQANQCRARAHQISRDPWGVGVVTTRPRHSDDWWAEFGEAMADNGVKHLIADNLERLLPRGKSSISDEAVMEVTWGLDTIASHGISVTLVHHESTKGGSGKPSGSFAVEAWARHLIHLKAPSGMSQPRRELKIVSNDGAQEIIQLEQTRGVESGTAFFRVARSLQADGPPKQDTHAERLGYAKFLDGMKLTKAAAGRALKEAFPGGPSERTHSVRLGEGAYPAGLDAQGVWRLCGT